MADRPSFDLRLYLVTDSTPEILGDKDICHVVEEALKGGVTLVQYRDKKSDTGTLIETARKLHSVTKKYKVPLLINDRIDVCLAVGADGVHIGQDDMSLVEARKLLPANAIVGVTACSVEEAQKAIADGADYLGLGTMFATPTYVDHSLYVHISDSLSAKQIQNRSLAPKVYKRSSPSAKPAPIMPRVVWPSVASILPMSNECYTNQPLLRTN